jgi:hypothetical protein
MPAVPWQRYCADQKRSPVGERLLISSIWLAGGCGRCWQIVAACRLPKDGVGIERGQGPGRVEAFRGAQPDVGLFRFGVVTAKNPGRVGTDAWRVALGKAEKSPFVEVTRGKKPGSGSSGSFGTSLTAVRGLLSGSC